MKCVRVLEMSRVNIFAKSNDKIHEKIIFRSPFVLWKTCE
jgi:hypothetical protein